MIELTDLTLAYETCLLDRVNYVFPDTGLIGIQGPSGCGKSTLLYSLSGLLKYSGSITFNGKEVDSSFCKMIGFVKQNNDLISSYNVEENILAGCYFGQITYEKRKMKNIIRRLKIDHLMKRYPNELSMGQMKRVSIARSLLKDAPVLLCDEPTGALHYKQAQEVMQLLKEVSKDRLVILVSHDQNLLNQYADTLLEFKNQTLIPLKSSQTKKEVVIPKRKKYLSMRYSFKEVVNERKRLALLIIFQSVVIVSLLMIVCGFNGLTKEIEKSYRQAPLKNVVTVSSHEGEPLTFQETAQVSPHFDIESGYIKGITASFIRLPSHSDHIQLLSGHFPRNSHEVIITQNLSKKLSSDFVFYLQKKMKCKVVGIIEDNFYQDRMVCFYHDIDQEYPELLRDDKMDFEINNPEAVIKRYEKNYDVENDVYMKKMSYGTLISIGKWIVFFYMLISMIVGIELTKTVFSSLYLERSHSLALKISMGATFSKLRQESIIEIFFIGSFIFMMSLAILYSFLALLPLTSFNHYFHFQCLSPEASFYLIFYLIYLFILMISASAPFSRIKKESIVALLREE